MILAWVSLVLLSSVAAMSASRRSRTTAAGPRVCVIGGGAAGFFSAIECAKTLRESGIANAEVSILEASKECLTKVLISGGGRCNVMHDETKDMTSILKAYPRGEKQLCGPFTKLFGPKDAAEWFQSRGVELKKEADGRVFPITDDSRTIAGLLWSEAEKYDVRVRTKCKVESIDVLNDGDGGDDGSGGVCITTNNEDKENYDRLIIATGSSRQGHGMMRKLGHKVIEPVPSLFSFVVKERALQALAGASVQNAHVSLVFPKDFPKSDEGKGFRPQFLKSLQSQGPVLFTHQGLSGPAIIKLSGFAARIMAAVKYKATLQIDWVHDMNLSSREDLHALFLQTKEGHDRKKHIGNLCLVPGLSKRVWHFLVTRAGISLERLWGDISKKEVNRLCEELFCGKYAVTGKGLFRDEFVTAGGVSLDEVTFTTYGSRLPQNNNVVYFAGECMDVDAITGGFNFQHAWTSGWVAGKSAAESLT